MTSVLNVAQYILKRLGGSADAMRLEKLCYYCQSWNLAWGFGKLFPERIEAWVEGPVIPALFARHKGQYLVVDVGGDETEIASNESLRERIDSVLSTYGHKSGADLSVLTHNEDPWFNARRGSGPRERSSREITDEAMRTYYRGLWRSSDAATRVAAD